MGNPVAIAELAKHPDQPFPEALEYLWLRARELHGRSGVGMSGFAPLNPLVLESMARLKGYTVTPLEAEALFALDSVLSHPDAGEEEGKTDG